MTHEAEEAIDLFCEDDDPVVVEREPPTYEGTTNEQKPHKDPEPIELDATSSAYMRLPQQLRRFVDGWVENRDLRELTMELGLSPSLTGVLVRREDIRDALRECLQVKYGTRIMGELEMQAHLSDIARDEDTPIASRIRAMGELAGIQGVKDRNVREARERLTNAVEVVVTREEGAAGTLTREQVAEMEDEAKDA